MTGPPFDKPQHVDFAAGGFGQAADLRGQLDPQLQHPQPPVVDEVMKGLTDAVAAPRRPGAFQRPQQVVRQAERQRDAAQIPSGRPATPSSVARGGPE